MNLSDREMSQYNAAVAALGEVRSGTRQATPEEVRRFVRLTDMYTAKGAEHFLAMLRPSSVQFPPDQKEEAHRLECVLSGAAHGLTKMLYSGVELEEDGPVPRPPLAAELMELEEAARRLLEKHRDSPSRLPPNELRYAGTLASDLEKAVQHILELVRAPTEPVAAPAAS